MTQSKTRTKDKKQTGRASGSKQTAARQSKPQTAEKRTRKTTANSSAKAAKVQPKQTKSANTPAPSRPAPARTGKTKVLPREFLADLARHLREAVQPYVREAKGREVVGAASSGDSTFKLDQVAEKALLSYLRSARKPVAYYSEDAGYTTFTSGPPEHLLIIDPVDGTRAAKCGFESCVVSIAATRVIERPRMADVDNACVMEIMGPRWFYAERGKGARVHGVKSTAQKPRLSPNVDLERMSWSMTVPARPAELIFPTAAKLIDLTSLKGGFFACNSTSFSLTRLLTNQLDACVDFANRFLRDMPEAVRDQFINAGRGITLGIAPYDLAASLLIAEEAGCVVTDAYGERFDDVLMLDSSESNHRSLIAAANPQLHEKLMAFFDKRIYQYERLLEKRAALAR